MNRSKRNLLAVSSTALLLLIAVNFALPVNAAQPKPGLPPNTVAKQNRTSPSRNQPAIELLQTHAMGGPQRVVFSKDGLRLENPNTGVVILSEAPYTHVLWCNPKKKLFYRIATEKSLHRMNSVKLVLETTSEFSDIPFEPPVETTVMGRPALLYQKHTPKKSWLKYWVLKEPKVQDAVLKQVCNFSGSLPKLGGLPLNWHQYVTKADMFNEVDRDAKPEVHEFFVTKSVKNITVPHSLFTCPSDYKETKVRNDVMSSSIGYGSFKDLIKSPDFLFQSSSKKLNGDSSKESTKSSEKHKQQN